MLEVQLQASEELPPQNEQEVALEQPATFQNDELVQKTTELYQVLDQDGDGLISKKELETARDSLTSYFAEDLEQRGYVEKLEHSEADTDGDGNVDQEEWKEFLLSIYELMGHKRFIVCVDTWLRALKDDSQVEVLGAEQKASPKRKSRKKTSLKARGAGSVTDDGTARAATKIQATFRGKMTRKSLESLAKASRVEQEIVSTEDLWQILLERYSEDRKRVPLADVSELFARCWDTGLSMELSSVVPMKSFTDKAAADPLTTEEVEALGKILCGIPEKEDALAWSVEEAKAELDRFRFPVDLELATYEEAVAEAKREEILSLAGEKPKMSCRRFTKLLEIVSSLMRIDVEYIVCHLAYIETGRFEIPETLVCLLCEQCAEVNQRRTSSSEFQRANTATISLVKGESLNMFLGLCTWMLLARNGGLIDSRGLTGLKGTDVQLAFQNVTNNMTRLWRERAQKNGKSKAVKDMVFDNKFILGRTQFELLLEEIFNQMPIEGRFRSPLDMAVSMLASATRR